MYIEIKIKIEEAEIDLENYQMDDGTQLNYTEAVALDIETFEHGDISLEELIYNFGGDVTINHAIVVSTENENTNNQEDSE